MKKILYCFFIPAFLISCNKKNRPNETIVTNDDIDIHWYKEATTISCYEVVEVKKADSSVMALKINCGLGIADISINGKEIVIRSLPKLFIYNFKEEVFDYKVKLDTAISKEYWYKKTFEKDRTLQR